ncbi:MAG: phosphate acyltransferase PlsX [Dehalococcoidia bacterium]
MTDTSTIAVDTMGGDDAPTTPVQGAVQAARNARVRVVLVGDEPAVRGELAKLDVNGLGIEVMGSEGVIQEGEHPARALLSKPKSSIGVAVGLVKSGEADALISMGSTGATMAASVLALGTFPGLDRPTLGGPFIGLAPKTTIIDLGANVDCKPSQLVSFGALGGSFARFYFDTANPRIGLLSVGAEEGKGNKQAQEAFALFQKSGLNFVGNVEGHEVFMDKADVIVCDGFVGNVLLKFTEGLAHAIAAYLGGALGNDSPAVAQIRGLTSGAEQGGGPLFGVNGVVIAGHGRSSAEGIAASIELARLCIEKDLVGTMREDLAGVMERTGADNG